MTEEEESSRNSSGGSTTRSTRSSSKKYSIGTVVSKYFDGYSTPFAGRVMCIVIDEDTGELLYNVRYDDGDEEDYNETELEAIVVAVAATTTPLPPPKKKKKRKTTKSTTKTTNNGHYSGSGNHRKKAKVVEPERQEGEEVESSPLDEEEREKENVAVVSSTTSSGGCGRPRRASTLVRKTYFEESDDVDDDEDEGVYSSEEDDAKSKKKRSSSSSKRKRSFGGNRRSSVSNGSKRSAKQPAKKKNRKTTDDDSSSSEFNDEEQSSDEEEELRFESEESSEEEDEVVPTGRTKNGKKKRNNKSDDKGASETTNKQNKKSGKPASESFQSIDKPLYPDLSLQEIRSQVQFLDPCGQEGTDDIIGRLVGEQVDKIRRLLQKSVKNSCSHMGSASLPLKLGTACSGTDAPSLAMTLVQEHLQRTSSSSGEHEQHDDDDGKGCFHFEHAFSCENDPFKQAYLARNFESVLYPDICKLTAERPVDAYGQVKPLPEFNLFVAGTSCKDFSMQRAHSRLDIEDRGCSGETFMAATEVLFKEKPRFAIFENVRGAPWQKMSEYITGRIKLSSCDETKAIQGASKQKNASSDLVFIHEGGKIIVDRVPAVFGVRCGAAVAGYLAGPTSTNVQKVTWPNNKSKSKSCTLKELMKTNGISRAEDTLVFETSGGVRYCTQLMNVDTKDFGLPQTRNRTYLFVWQTNDIRDNLGAYWQAIVEHLKSPVRHSLEAFILQVDHDIIRVFREALRGPPGRVSRASSFLEPDFWSSTSSNLPHCKNPRKVLGLRDRARTQTQWGPYGAKQIPPHYWPEYLDLYEQRALDCIEIFHASGLRDAESHDSNFASFVWNTSQNATREKHRSARPGIAGCVTPGGDLLLPHMGRPLLGCEKLLLQGIPYFRLALGTETEVQLGDLAGNAMSLTVVSACMLAAITCHQLRDDHLRDKKNNGREEEELPKPGEIRHLLDSYSVRKATIDCAPQSTTSDDAGDRTEEFAINDALIDLADDAVANSILCTCESSGQMSTSSTFLQCTICKTSCCRNCCNATSGYQLGSHSMVEIHEAGRTVHFESMLRNVLPPAVFFNDEDLAQLVGTTPQHANHHDPRSLAGKSFTLHRVKRGRRKWIAVYFCREGGFGEALGEFRLSVGELSTLHGKGRKELGVLGELTSFLPARVPPFVFGPLDPVAVCKYTKNNEELFDESSGWKKKSDTILTGSLRVVGSEPVASNRAEAGLTQTAAKSLKSAPTKHPRNKKQFSKAKQHNEERRWLYPNNWEQWPGVLTISSTAGSSSGGNNDTVESVTGTYRRANCRQTVNQNALWIRDEEPVYYLLLKPEVSRTGPDTAIISRSLSHDDKAEIVATFPDLWDPCDALEPKTQTVDNVTFHTWSEISTMRCFSPISNITIDSPPEKDGSHVLMVLKGLAASDIRMLTGNSGRGSDDAGTINLRMAQGQRAQQAIRAFNATCAAKILKHAAAGRLQYDLSPNAQWIKIQPKDASVPFGCCQKTCPPRPPEQWKKTVDEREVWDRVFSEGESRKFYQALDARPRAFDFKLDKAAGSLEVKIDPYVVAHHAAGYLLHGRDARIANDIAVSFRLSDSQLQKDPVLEKFVVRSCSEQEPTDVPLKAPYALYERQQKAVSKMLAIENRETTFTEVEMYDEEMPGATSWSLIAKAERETQISGGVIADAIGAGKTVISIALMLQGLEESRKSAKFPNRSAANLVVVPPGLIKQWFDEIHKFSDGMKVICIYGLDDIKKTTIADMLHADCVICSIDMLEAEQGYLAHLLRKSEMNVADEDIPKLPSYSGQKELAGAKGVWIPATSADPYMGSNSNLNQQRRNESARYTHIYLGAVHKIREKQFAESTKGLPLEYFEWHRIFVDEIHESLCTTKAEVTESNESRKNRPDVNDPVKSGIFTEKNRRAGRELLGIMTRDPTQRPLLYRKAVFALTGTPLLDSPSRVIELASLVGNTYVIGLSSHWRKLERESCRDIFLHYYLEPKQSREIRKNLYLTCQNYISTACCRNKVGDEMGGIKLVEHKRVVKMSEEEGKSYLASQSGIREKSFSITPEDFDVASGHDITRFLRQNVSLDCRKQALLDICRGILAKDSKTKIVVFADGRIGGGIAAREALTQKGGPGCTWLDVDDSTQVRNQKISWYQHGDATDEDRARPRVLVLHFDHAAGLNLQSQCYSLILFSPLYRGQGGVYSDVVSDVSTELQAIGRVYRPGQTKPTVDVWRIEARGPGDEECLDGQLIRKNTDEETKAKAVNNEE